MDVTGSVAVPGGGDSAEDSSATAANDDEDGADESPRKRKSPPCPPDKRAIGACPREGYGVIPAPRAPDPAVPVVTVEQVARFVPTTATVVSEPARWGLVRTPVNFLVAGAETRVLDGSVLGAGVQVRFTAVGVQWDAVGEGPSVSEGVGRPWGEEEFTETGTSRVFPETGDVRVGATVRWAAEFRVGGGSWNPVGVVSSAAAPAEVLIVRERTVLTRGDCRQYPDDPGC